MPALDRLVIDSEFGFLEMLVEWLDRATEVRFEKDQDGYICNIIYLRKVYWAYSDTVFSALKIAVGAATSADLYGEVK